MDQIAFEKKKHGIKLGYGSCDINQMVKTAINVNALWSLFQLDTIKNRHLAWWFAIAALPSHTELSSELYCTLNLRSIDIAIIAAR